MKAKAEPMLFLDWFADQYDAVGLPSEENLRQSAAYLQGFIDAMEPESRAYMHGALNNIRSAEVIVRALKQYQVRMPHG